MRVFLFLLCVFQLHCFMDAQVYLKPFSSVWFDHESGIPPFIFSGDALRLFKKDALLGVIERNTRNLYLPLWQRYITTYTSLHEWYFRLYPYCKKELYRLASKKGKGVTIGCIDTGMGVVSKEHEYEIHPALQENSVVTPLTYYNCIEDIVHALFYHIAVPYSIWCSRFHFLEDRVYGATVTYLRDHSLQEFIVFIKRYGKEILFADSFRNEFSQEGYYLLEKIKKKLEQIVPIAYNGILVPEDTLGYASKAYEHAPLYQVNHGGEVMGIMIGKSVDYEGIAPQAHCMMAKVFLKDARCTGKTFLEGLLMMIKHKIPLVCMSLQIPEDALSDDMRTIITYLMSVIPYTVAPSGNDSSTKEYVSFPASIATFSVGSFSYNVSNNTYPITSFSQYKQYEGPLYVMPGSAFLMPYTMYNDTKIEHNYIVSHGTSFAAAFMTGLLALFLAETAEHNFTYKEILTILYSSGLFLQTTSDWETKSILGTLDISTAIFRVLVLRRVKCESIMMRYLCEKYFDECVGIMRLLLQEASCVVHFHKDDGFAFFKTIICSLLAHDNRSEKMISHHVHSACYELLYGLEKTSFFSNPIKSAIDAHSQAPSTFDYDLFVRVFGIYEAERIREYVESYIVYYWK